VGTAGRLPTARTRDRAGRARRATSDPQRREESVHVPAHEQVAVRGEAGEARCAFARKLQELIGGAYGEMTVTMQYLFQGWNCRVEGKYKDRLMDIATEEIGHVEMLATMVT
jgi:hypothetical protein